MLANFRYTLTFIARNRALLFWPLAFPLIMSVIFSLMFSHVDESYELRPVAIGVVRDAALEEVPGLAETLRSVAGGAGADAHYVDLVDFADEGAATAAVRDGRVAGYVGVGADGMPTLHLSQSDLDEERRLHLSAVVAVLNGYVRVWHELRTVATDDPGLLVGDVDPARLAALVDPATGTVPDEAVRALADEALAAGAEDVVDRFTTDAVHTRRLRLTRAEPDASARYFYALLGMAASLGALIACEVVRTLAADAGPLGARRTLAGLPRGRLLVSSLAASWLASLACLVAGFLFMWLVVGVDFGDRVAPCLVAMAVSTLAFSALGALVGTLPGLPGVIISGVSTLLSFFAGLYGTASQRVADGVALSQPALAAANPVRQTAQAFYSLLYYDSLDRFAQACSVLAVMAVAFAALATVRMRRQRHAQL